MGAAIWDMIREATRTSHSRLDIALSRLGIAIPIYYEAFLRSQAEALFPIEAAKISFPTGRCACAHPHLHATLQHWESSASRCPHPISNPPRKCLARSTSLRRHG